MAMAVRSGRITHMPQPVPVTYGAIIRIRHQATGAFLSSLAQNYCHAGSSEQQIVGGTAKQDSQTLWLVKPAHHQNLEDRVGQVVNNGDTIRLEHVDTRRNLHTHNKPAPLTGAIGQYEVTAYSDRPGEGNEADNWLVFPEAGAQLTTDSPFRLKHGHPGGWVLHSHGQADQKLTAGRFEVTAVVRGDQNDVFECLISESPDDRGGRTVAAVDQEKALVTVERISRHFDDFARQINKRRAGRQGFQFGDEYDVQDALHAVLRLHFDDVRAEEYGPSVAGGHGRMDFLLRECRIGVETKMTRLGLGPKEIVSELAEDAIRFGKHPDLDYLCCFVYDPERRCGNPAGIETDLSTSHGRLQVRVIVGPR
jgi:hypothetical protein